MTEPWLVQGLVITLILVGVGWFLWKQQHHRLQGQLQLTFMALLLVTVMSLVLVSVGQIRQTLTAQADQALLAQATGINQELGAALAQEINLLRTLSQESALIAQITTTTHGNLLQLPNHERTTWWQNRDKDWREQIDSTLREEVLSNVASQKLEAFSELFPIHNQLLLVDHYGALIAVGGSVPTHYYYAHQPWWPELRQSSWIYVGHPQIQPNQQVTIDIVVPIVAAQSNRVVGVLWSQCVLQGLAKFVKPQTVARDILVTLVDASGLILYSSNPLHVGQILPSYETHEAITSMAWQSSTGQALGVAQVPFVVPSDPLSVPNLKWTTVVQHKKAETLIDINRLSEFLLWNGLLILMIALAASYRVVFHFTSPIANLGDMAAAVAQRKMDELLPTARSVELQRITDAVNQLTVEWRSAVDQAEQRLIAHTHELEVALRETEGLFKAAQAILGARELEGICQNLIIHFNQLVQADQMILYLVEHETQTVLLCVKHGIDYDEAEMSYTELNEGISGIVFRSKRPVISLHYNDGIEPAATRERRRINGVGPLVVVPLVTKDNVIGTITAINFVNHRVFNQHDVDLLMALATQAAAAIENVQLYQLSQQELTERKRAEAALQIANAELAKINADKDKFFSIMAHDLKAPFMPLLGASELIMQLSNALTRSQLKQMAEVINTSAKNVYNLLDNILHWARLQQGQMRYKPQLIKINELVVNTIELLRGNAEAKRIKLESSLTTELLVYVDRYMVETILRNLVSNALKFTAEGGEVIVKAQPLDEAWLEVSVMDTGTGISDLLKEKLFKIDQHVTTVGTAKEQGTGLGLMICAEMVHQHGGKITVDSQLEQGTTVKFTIPRVEKVIV